MTSKVVRVSEEALQAASAYGDDLSTAILLMQARIEELRGVYAEITALRQEIPDEKQLKKIITGAVNDCFADFSRGY
ncbi:MAG TPA: hypothetical protein O0X50_00885 [Methanocorpusculum sp.]|nr:hypothetical protein [Methanocorpusculum sp.]